MRALFHQQIGVAARREPQLLDRGEVPALGLGLGLGLGLELPQALDRGEVAATAEA